MNPSKFYSYAFPFLRLICLLVSFSLPGLTITAQVAEKEPNNSFETADTIHAGSVKSGSTNNVSDPVDYFATSLPADGTMKIYMSATNQGTSNGYLYLYGYDRRQGNGQVLAKYISNNSNVPPGATVNDTITLFGRAADDFYFRLQAAGNFTYSLGYNMADTSINDVEPNNSFQETLPINRLQEKQGHIAYAKNGTTDADDFYKTVLPIDGTLKIYVHGINQSGGNGYLYLYGYDGRQQNGQVLAHYISNNSNVPAGNVVNDTVLLYGRAADTFISGCCLREPLVIV